MYSVIADAIHIFPQTNKTCYMKKSQKTINKNSDMVENYNFSPRFNKNSTKHYSVCSKEKMEHIKNKINQI